MGGGGGGGRGDTVSLSVGNESGTCNCHPLLLFFIAFDLFFYFSILIAFDLVSIINYFCKIFD